MPKEFSIMIMRSLSIIKYILLLFVLCSSCSCHKENRDEVSRTVLIYFAANNSLDWLSSENIKDLAKGYVPDYFEPGESKNGEVLLYYLHRRDSLPILVRVSKDKFGKVQEETIVEYDMHNSMNDSVINNVLNYAHQLFPAKENGLILWSHGTGWLPVRYYSNPTGASYAPKQMSQEEYDEYHSYDYLVKSFGQDGSNETDIINLAKAIPFQYSYIIFDACLMGGIEVAYEFKNKAEYQMFSATEILASGFPYNLIMEPLLYSNANMEDRLKETATRYFNYYNEQSSVQDRSATIAVIKSSALDGLAISAKTIFSTGRDNIDTLTMSTIQGFFQRQLPKPWYYDLDDFMSRIYTDESHYSSFTSELNKTVLYSAHTDYFIKGNSRWNFKIEKYSGLSTYIPNPENIILDTYYRNYSWNQEVEMIK